MPFLLCHGAFHNTCVYSNVCNAISAWNRCVLKLVAFVWGQRCNTTQFQTLWFLPILLCHRAIHNQNATSCTAVATLPLSMFILLSLHQNCWYKFEISINYWTNFNILQSVTYWSPAQYIPLKDKRQEVFNCKVHQFSSDLVRFHPKDDYSAVHKITSY